MEHFAKSWQKSKILIDYVDADLANFYLFCQKLFFISSNYLIFVYTISFGGQMKPFKCDRSIIGNNLSNQVINFLRNSMV